MPFPCNLCSCLYVVPRSLLLESLGLLMVCCFYANSDVFCGQKIQGENGSSFMLQSTVLGDQESSSIQKCKKEIVAGIPFWFS